MNDEQAADEDERQKLEVAADPPAGRLVDEKARATPSAAGLKICRRLIARMYFDAIAHTDMKMMPPSAAGSSGVTGLRISIRMRAVMNTNSLLLVVR